MGPGEAFAFISLVVSIAGVVILRGPLGRAIAERIAGRHGADPAVNAEVERLGTQVDELRHRLTETEERLDFAERLLAKQKQQPALPER